MLRFAPLGMKLMEKDTLLREASEDDCPQVRDMIQDLAEYEKMPDGPKITFKDLQNDGFYTDNPIFKCYVISFYEDSECDLLLAYATYFYLHTTLDRKAVHLEDLYVRPEYRKSGFGSRLFDKIAKKTFEENGQYLDFSVINWNPAKEFYEHKGALNMTKLEGVHAFRISRESLSNYASMSGRYEGYLIRDANIDDLEPIRDIATEALATQTIRISKYKNPIPDKVAVLNVDETSHAVSSSYFGYLVVELDKVIYGYALYCYGYSTWEGKSMYLQEFYVCQNDQYETMRLDLYYAVAKKAVDQNCCRLDFWIKDLKNYGEFFKANGAVDLTETEEWQMYRLYDIPKKPA